MRTVLPTMRSASSEAWVNPGEERAFPWTERKSGAAFGFTDVDGKLSTVEAMKGKVLVVVFFATSCEPSLRQMLDVAQLQPKGAQFGFEIIPVHMESWSNIAQMTRKWAEVRQVRYYRSGISEHGLTQLGPDLSALPTVYVLDREGRIAHAYIGFLENRLSAVLRRYLAEQPVAKASTTPPQPEGQGAR